MFINVLFCAALLKRSEAAMNKKVPEITESAEDLKALLRNSTQAYQTQRLSALYLLRSGQAKNRKQVA